MFQFLQRAHNLDSLIDGIHTTDLQTRVDGNTLCLDFEKDPSHMGGNQFIVRRLTYNDGICLLPMHRRNERAVAPALLITDRGEFDRTRQLKPRILYRLDCHDRSHEPCFHITGTDAIESSARDDAAIGIVFPFLWITDGHRINMTVEENALRSAAGKFRIDIEPIIISMTEISLMIFFPTR